MMRKGFSIPFYLVIVAILIIGGQFLYFQSKIVSTTRNQPSPAPTPIPRITINSLSLTPLEYRFFAKEFSGDMDYPEEMKSLSKNELKNIIGCSDISSVELFEDVISKESLDKVLKNGEPDLMYLCDAGDIYIFMYEYEPLEGNIYSIWYVALAQKEPPYFKELTEIPFEQRVLCDVLALTKTNFLYIECSGGHLKSIYKINTISGKATLLLSCDVVDKNGKKFGVCADEDEEVHREKLGGITITFLWWKLYYTLYYFNNEIYKILFGAN